MITIDLNDILTRVLIRAAGVNVYPFLKPEYGSLPCLVYHRITDDVQDSSHNEGGSIHFSRVQIDHIASTPSGTFGLERTVNRVLEGNKTDFAQCMSAGTHIERQDADDVFVVTKDYMIQWKSR